MSRRMACSLTIDAVRSRIKTVTRRHANTWGALLPGQRLTLIEQGMGLPKGAEQVVLAETVVVSNEIVSLDDIDQADVDAEGFPHLTPAEFIDMWCRSHGVTDPANVRVRRIEWRYLDE